ncbi:MFS transporter [Cuniculiplasma sp. SKW3]|uniref:MFS transporter n=1 Tax=Cuniculiplasma sp. SKW3 TaxID=3400170 RepID=UPI003FD27D1B
MRTDIRALISTSFAHFSNDGVFFLFSTLIVYFENPTVGINALFLGYFAVIYTFIAGVLSIPIGKKSDGNDKDPELMGLGIVLLAISILFFAFVFYSQSSLSITWKYLFVVLGAIFLGSGQAFYHPLGADILRYSLKGKDSSVFLGINGSMGSLGRALIISVATLLITVYGAFQGLLFLAISYFIIALLVYLSSRKLRKPEYVMENQKKSERKESKVRSIKSFPGVRAFLVVLTLTLITRSIFQMSVALYIFSFLNSIYQNKVLTAYFLSIALITPILGQPIFGYITKRVGGNTTLFIAGLISLASFVPFIVFQLSYTYALILFSIYAFAAFTGFPSILGFVGQKIPKELSTRANTWTWGVGNTAGGAVGIFLFTILNKYLDFSYRYSFELMLSFMVLSIILNLMVYPYSSRLESQITQ